MGQEVAELIDRTSRSARPAVTIPNVGNQPRVVANRNSMPIPSRKYGVEYRIRRDPLPT